MHPLNPWQQRQPNCADGDVRRPDASPRREFALPRESRSYGKHQIVAAHDGYRRQKTGCAASTAWLRAYGQGDECECQAGPRKCQPALKLHLRFAFVWPMLLAERRHRTLRIRKLQHFPFLAFVDCDGQIALCERRQPVMVRILQRIVVDASVTQVQLQLALCAVGNYNGFVRECEM